MGFWILGYIFAGFGSYYLLNRWFEPETKDGTTFALVCSMIWPFPMMAIVFAWMLFKAGDCVEWLAKLILARRERKR